MRAASRWMNTRLLIVIATETDIVVARKRTRRLAELIGYDRQDQTRVTTAVSEIVRNAFEYAGGGQIEFRLADDPPATFVIMVRDRGPGIADLDAIWPGLHTSATGMGVGLLGRNAVDGRIRCRDQTRRARRCAWANSCRRVQTVVITSRRRRHQGRACSG